MTVSPTFMIIVSPGAGTLPQDQVNGSFQSPLPTETQVAAIEFRLVRTRANINSRLFMVQCFRV